MQSASAGTLRGATRDFQSLTAILSRMAWPAALRALAALKILCSGARSLRLSAAGRLVILQATDLHFGESSGGDAATAQVSAQRSALPALPASHPPYRGLPDLQREPPLRHLCCAAVSVAATAARPQPRTAHCSGLAIS